MQNFLGAKEQESHQTADDIQVETVHNSVIEEDTSESDEEQNENEDCLNIEVLHSENRTPGQNVKFTCNLCSFKSQRESHYIKHMALHETKSTIHCCEHCSFSTCSITRLRRHQVTHSSNTLTCSSCNYSTDDPKLLARHQRVKHKVFCLLLKLFFSCVPHCYQFFLDGRRTERFFRDGTSVSNVSVPDHTIVFVPASHESPFC